MGSARAICFPRTPLPRVLTPMRLTYWWGRFALAASLLVACASQVGGADLNDPTDLGRRFVASNWFGAAVTAGIVAAHF